MSRRDVILDQLNDGIEEMRQELYLLIEDNYASLLDPVVYRKSMQLDQAILFFMGLKQGS